MNEQNCTKFLLKEFSLKVSFVVLCLCLANANGSYNHYRLPVSLRPEQYQLRVITHLEKAENLTFEGQVSIRFQALEDTTNITLHAKNLTIDENRIQLQSYQDEEFHFCLEGVETVPEYDYYIIRLCQPLHKDQVYKLTLEFSGILNKEPTGYYRNSYVEMKTKETRWLSMTHFEPVEARKAFPCFDEPNYKATFVIWLGHHKSLTALSNMPREKQIPLDERPDYVWSIFEESVPMSTYVVAYSVNDYAHKETHVEGNDVVFRTWCRPDYIEYCSYAAEIAPKLLKFYEKTFGIAFPLKKLDQIAVPNLPQNGMENWGLITYRENKMLYNPGVLFEQTKLDIAIIISHELAHQWFGNLVTLKWWTDIWLNEGFATYVANIGVHHLKPELDINVEKSVKSSIDILKQDNKPISHPLSQTIQKGNEINEHFDDISYFKGSLILRMMHSFLGQEDFFEGVRDYLTKYKYKNAEQDDLWATFSEIAHKNKRIPSGHDVKTIMDSWTLQAGYPVVNVRRTYENGSIEITQQRFFENVTLSTEESHSCWWVPLSYTTSRELNFNTTLPKAWLECDDAGESVPLSLDNVPATPDEWLIFNIQLSGIYRVMYDTRNWRLIQKTLNSERFTDINVINRIHIVDDVLSFAWSDCLDYGIALDIVGYMSRERELLPFMYFVEHLTKIYSILQHYPQEVSYFKAFMGNIIEPIYASIHELKAINKTSTFSPFHKLIFHTACSLDVEDCVQTAMELFEQYKITTDSISGENSIPLNLQHMVFCTVIRHGGYEDWTFLFQRYKAAKSPPERLSIMISLGCSTNSTLLEDFLQLLFDGEELVEKTDTQYGLMGVARQGIGSSLALKYFGDHIHELHDNGFNAAILSGVLIPNIVDTADIVLFKDLMKSNGKYFEYYGNTLNSMLEESKYKLHWAENILPNMISELRKRIPARHSTEDI